MSDFRLDKHPLSVTLFLADGVVREGVVFLSPDAERHSGPQTLLELLREREPFFPFRDATGRFALVNKAAVTHVRYVAVGREELVVGIEQEVHIVFFGGELLQGTIRLAMPAGQARLQDYVNAAPGFFPLSVGTQRYIVNGALLREIRPA